MKLRIPPKVIEALGAIVATTAVAEDTMMRISKIRLRGFALALCLLAVSLMGLGLTAQWARAQDSEHTLDLPSEPVVPGEFHGDVRVLPKPEPSPPMVIPRFARPPEDPDPYSKIVEWPESDIDPLLSRPQIESAELRTFNPPDLNIPGIPWQNTAPPDTVGDIGSNHYIQMTNSRGAVVQIFGKDGTSLAGPFDLRDLSTDGSSACGSTTWEYGHQSGDPIVLYDHLADRWLMSQLAAVGPQWEEIWHLCVYVSMTDDPIAGGWFSYDFETTFKPDYPKYAVWPDAYFVSSVEPDGPAAYALDRSNMLAGLAADPPVRRTSPFLAGFGWQALIPSDLDGPAPPAGSPNFFMRHRDDEVHNAGSNDPSNDFLEIWEFSVDFTTPANSTFANTANIPVAEFDSDLCGLAGMECFPQPGTYATLDPLREVIMWRLQYRNFETHETLVGNFVTDVNGNDQGGIRWFELRRTPPDTGAWVLFQEGTHSPDTDNRWMGSIAMDQLGNIALGYSVSSTTTFPSIAYTGRLSSDTPGTMPLGEMFVVNGMFSQHGFISRWGDYSSMNVDPVDGCTFWYTNEFVGDDESTPFGPGSTGRWATQIASFTLDDSCACLAAQPSVLYVSENGSSSNSGASPSDALDSPSRAANCAQAGAEEIRIAQGTYPSFQPMSITEPVGDLLIQGGWSADFTTRSEDPSLTVIDGGDFEGSLLRIYLDSGSTQVTVEGLTLQDGYAVNMPSVTGPTVHGGAISASAFASAHLTLNIRNNRILDNNATASGGGIYALAHDGGSITAVLENNTIARNTAEANGGGMRLGSGSGGTLLATLKNNVISDNSAGWYGGGATFGENGGTTIVSLANETITGNSAARDGGGVSLSSVSGGSTAAIVNSIFAQNGASKGGGLRVANFAPTITNSTFHDNSADIGGAVYNLNADTVITNSILWGDTSATGYEIDNEDGAIPVVTYCNVDGGYAGEGNIPPSDPGFVDAANGDLRLTAASPCIDTGDNNAPGLQVSDLGGDLRIIDGNYDGEQIVDMGAYEYRNPEAGSAPTPTGSGVEVEVNTYFTHPVTGEAAPLDVRVTYDQVIDSGQTTVVPRYETLGEIGSEFKVALGDYSAVFFDVLTPANVGGPISVCVNYPDSEVPLGIVDGTSDTSECDLEILHDEGGEFLPRTAAIGDATCPFAETTCSHNLCIDTANNEICAKVSDTSPFIVAIRTTAPSAAPRAVTVGYGTLDVTGVAGVPLTITWSDRDVELSGAFRDNVVNLGNNPFVTSPMPGSGWVGTPSGAPASGAFGAHVTSPGFSFDLFGFYICPDTVGACTSNGPEYDAYFSEVVAQGLTGPILGPSSGQLPRYGSLGEEIIYTTDASVHCAVSPPSTVATCTGNIVLNAYSPPLPNTPVGDDVEVQIETSFTHPDTGVGIPLDVAVTYDAVTSDGTTTVIPWSYAPGDMSDNFSVAVGEWQSVFFDVSTDASVTGPIVICTGYPDANNDGYVDGSYADECRVRVLHREAGVYQDRTLTAVDPRCPLDSSPWCDGMCIDADNNEICVGVDDLSMFTQVVLNEVPIADPGDDQVIYEIGTLVVLDGSKSTDPDGDDPITFAWTVLQKPVTSLAELDDPSSATPMFVPDVYGDYRFELVVTDALDKSSQPEQVLVSFENVPPVADAGDHQAVRVGHEVWLDGLRSYDPNGDDPLSLFYLWTLVSAPEGSAAVIADAGAPETSFVADVPGIYVVELLVNDGELTSEPSMADITATTAQSDLIDTLHYAVEVVNGLSPDDFTNKQLQKNMAKHLGQALALLDKGEYADARYKIDAEVRKTDGCANDGMPDTNDWIDGCVAQEQIHPALVHALALLDEVLGG